MLKAKKEKVTVKKVVKPGKASTKAKKVVSKVHPVKAKAAVKPLKPKTIIKKIKEEVKPPVLHVVKHVHKTEVKIETKPVIQPEPKIEIKPVHKPEVKIQAQPQVKPALKPEAVIIKPAAVIMPAAEPVAVAPGKEVELELPVTVKDLAIKLQEKSSVIIKLLMGMGVMAGINQALDEIVANKICLK
ncbi:MAG: translation initiation factor IF-2 N-terminal domain-containing protein, partial [Candidatus Omnitrophica bacterium]|nr:translation initiation factor IF-2 N-terminal domain-containing protein [Candidatus Omnitrophota bacterium]